MADSGVQEGKGLFHKMRNDKPLKQPKDKELYKFLTDHKDCVHKYTYKKS